ncbi:39S ribosomal protein L51 like protein [Argiope bruennichi]|uniref:Large ribosomal subunit protein mL51 n=1 Tax=Argiope bruennichi TaxID=94029 RepID=A0A8T0ESE6_ARGBR|nr:39S ribosomal protein L51 like protein [Argiope bruennichi]
MNSFCTRILKNVVTCTVEQVRYIRETPWKKEYLRRYGYEDPFFKRPDTLPRLPEKHKNLKLGLSHLPEYKPYKPWSDKRKYFGQNDYIDTLPRLPEKHKNLKLGLSHLPEYKPYKPWSDKRKYFGQNDYIDILGDGSIHPVKLLTNMPPWLRGFSGNEFQMLLKKQVYYSHWRWSKPTKWKNLNKRVMWLYRYLNRKRKQ